MYKMIFSKYIISFVIIISSPPGVNALPILFRNSPVQPLNAVIVNFLGPK